MQERNAKPTAKPKVGLIVPIYNVEKYLAECLDSLLNQSYENLEIVLVDDKSTDSSLEIAREYVERDRRVSLIALGENSGQSVARNVAMDYLSGESYRQKVEQRLRGGGAVYRHIDKLDGGSGLGGGESFLKGLAGDLIEDCDGEVLGICREILKGQSLSTLSIVMIG